MAGSLEATVVMAKCSKSKQFFGIRAEKRGNTWARTWAFPIDETKAKNEGFFSNKVSISATDNDYPGCPYCKDGGFIMCSCGKVSCSSNLQKNGDKSIFTCPWCGNLIEVKMADSIEVSGGGY